MTRPSFFIVLFLLPVSVCALQLHPFSLSVSHEYEHPAEKTKFRSNAQTGFLRASVELHGSGGYISGNPDLYTWNIRLRPLDQLQLLSGSITLSGLPSRVKNMVAPITSPLFRPLTVSQAAILSPGTTRMTETTGAEFRSMHWGLSLFGNPRTPAIPGSWLHILFTSPGTLPGNTTIQGALYAGFRQHTDKASTAWFPAEPSGIERPVIFPAAELILTNTRITTSITVMRNISRLYTDTSAIRSDAAISFRQVTLAGRYFRSDAGYIEFDGSRTSVRERRLIAPSIICHIPGTERTTGRVRLLYSHDTLSTDSPDEPVKTEAWMGGRISVENPRMIVQGTLTKSGTQYRFSAKTIVYRLHYPWLRLDLAGKAELPENGESFTALKNHQYRVTFTAKTSTRKHRAKFSLSGCMKQKDRETPIVYTLEGGLMISAKTAHFDQILRLEYLFSPQQHIPEGKLSLSVLLH